MPSRVRARDEARGWVAAKAAPASANEVVAAEARDEAAIADRKRMYSHRPTLTDTIRLPRQRRLDGHGAYF